MTHMKWTCDSKVNQGDPKLSIEDGLASSCLFIHLSSSLGDGAVSGFFSIYISISVVDFGKE